MKINNKSAFTIAELIITTVIMAVVMVVAPIITLKRSVKPAVAKKFDFIAICTTKCIFDAQSTIIKEAGAEDTRLDYNKNSNEFYTIELVGGGGGGTGNSFGFPGESKVLFLPSLNNNKEITNLANDDASKFGGILTGYYLMEAGAGGAKAKTGSPSRICIISKTEAQGSPASLSCDNKIIIATAKGGITSKEKAEFFGESDTQRQASVAAEAEEYGWGGNKNSKGKGGVIVIK